jgi:two-component system, chemotaxis family, protein-glutamate methylesterase/glutaminase
VVNQMPDERLGPCCAVAIGASAGGVQALRTVVAALPVDLPAAVFIVLHLDPRGPSRLPALLAAVTSLRVRDVRREPRVDAGSLYVAVPDHHLVVSDGGVRLDTSPPVHHMRPSVDRLFESVALVWAAGAVGVVLTGNGVDGASGVSAIKGGGGRTFAQDPAGARYPGMPRAAIATGHVDAVLPLVDIGPAIVQAVAVVAAGQAA